MQPVHADRARTGVIDWTALQTLSAALLIVTPTLGAQVAHATIVGRAASPDAGLSVLDELEAQHDLDDFQPFHATRADLLRRTGASAEARRHFERAANLARDTRIEKYLQGCADRLRWGRSGDGLRRGASLRSVPAQPAVGVHRFVRYRLSRWGCIGSAAIGVG